MKDQSFLKDIFGPLFVFMLIALGKYDPDMAAQLQTANSGVETADRELYGRVDISSKSGITKLILASDLEAEGTKNFNGNKLQAGQHFAFDRFRLALGNNIAGVAGGGTIGSPTVRNVLYSPDIFAKNDYLKPNRSAASGAADAWGVPVQRIPNDLLNARVQLIVGEKVVLNQSARRIFQACSASPDGYMALNVPKFIPADKTIDLQIVFPDSATAMPATTFIEFSIAGVGTNPRVV